MALILALNPGNRHSPTLARLARELPGCELIGAESSNVAISAIKKRVPDVVLLPATQARGQADLLAHLKTIRGGVMTLKLPPVESADPAELAREIRELLTGVPSTPIVPPNSVPAVSAPVHGRAAAAPVRAPAPVKVPPRVEPPPGPSPDVLAAATAAIAWARTRREQWLNEPRPQETAPVSVPSHAAAPERVVEVDEYQPYEPIEPAESDYLPLETPEEPQPAVDHAAQIKVWLPRLAGAAVALGVVAAIVLYKPQSGTDSAQSPPAEPAAAPAPVEANPSTADPAASKPEPAIDQLATVSGWVAVSSPFEVIITARGRGAQMDDRGRAMLPPGKHRLRFQNRDRGYDETLTVEVKPGETTTLTLTPQTTLSVTSSDPAEVLIDGTRAGETPYEGKISLGTHTVTVKTAEAERQQTVEATSKPVQLEIDFSKP